MLVHLHEVYGLFDCGCSSLALVLPLVRGWQSVSGMLGFAGCKFDATERGCHSGGAAEDGG